MPPTVPPAMAPVLEDVPVEAALMGVPDGLGAPTAPVPVPLPVSLLVPPFPGAETQVVLDPARTVKV